MKESDSIKTHDLSRWALLLCLAFCGACSSPAKQQASEAPPWQVVAQELDEAVLSIHGTSAADVWAVGADKGKGPLVLHWDGKDWTKQETGSQGDLWWVHAFDDGSVFLGGANSTILRWQGDKFVRMATPGLANSTVFGLWGRAADDVYAVGSSSGRNGFMWHFDGSAWSEVALPEDVPEDAQHDIPGLFKVWGNASGAVFAVGAHGLMLRAPADADFAVVPTGVDATLFTVFADSDQVYAVGGEANGVILNVGERALDETPEASPLIQGVCVGPKGEAFASGQAGTIYEREGSTWKRVDTKIETNIQSLHAMWIDPEGNVWSTGGNVISGLDRGLIIRRGEAIASYEKPAATTQDGGTPIVTCPKGGLDLGPEHSIARRWDEQILSAIRRDLPRPTVHARNLYHLSAAIWDAYASYDPKLTGVFAHELTTATDLEAERAEAISYAAYGVLSQRYGKAIGGPVSLACFAALMEQLGFDPDDARVEGDSPRALGNRIANALIAQTKDDGANEASNYADTTGYKSPNAALVVEHPGVTLVDPDHWQPLNLAQAVTQNGIPMDAGVQGYIGAQWDDVVPFAMTRDDPNAFYHDPGEPPKIGPEMVEWITQIIQRTAAIDTEDGAMIDISPGTYGNNSLAQNDGKGRALNPITNQPYAPEPVKRGDFARVLAEFWADGPMSETPPGHWNTIANSVADQPAFARRWHGRGDVLDPLAWDVRIYLALNGAVHDAAITAWGIKRRFTSARPISLVRYMASLGQSTDPALPAYHEHGLPLIPGLIERITTESAEAGERHAHLARYLGELAIRSYRGEPGDRKNEIGGVGWIRASEWIPYQRRTFVTPAFPGFISGHSTFSRASAEVLTAATGSPYFPGGLGEYVAKQNTTLAFEKGPSSDVRLQWATYYDAADQAGQSRIYGGIHIQPDDFVGRTLGSRVGLAAMAKAETFFAGTAQH
jgi:hypothetical protein